MTDPLTEQVEQVLPVVVSLRRELHAHPELSRREHQTSHKVRSALGHLAGVQVLDPLVGTDVVAVLNPDRQGRCIALRADMDALPITEATSLPYRSTVPGVMHACGHDGHTAVLLGTAMVLSRLADSLPGKVKFIFQPDEEDGGAARLLCERGALDAPPVDAVIALHAWPEQPVGTVAVRPGQIMAANTAFFITLRGRGAHGAHPHLGVDPIVIAAHIITALQTVVARTVDPLDAAVVTVGQVAAGSATNIIPPECFMKGTLRYLRNPTGESLRQRVRSIAEHTARAHGAEAEVRFESGYPAMTNNPALTGLIQETARDLLGPEHLVTDEPPSMGVEDFAFYAQHVPAAMFRLGVRPQDADDCPGLHNPRFNFNDDALPVGIRMLCAVVQRFLSPGRDPSHSIIV